MTVSVTVTFLLDEEEFKKQLDLVRSAHSTHQARPGDPVAPEVAGILAIMEKINEELED